MRAPYSRHCPSASAMRALTDSKMAWASDISCCRAPPGMDRWSDGVGPPMNPCCPWELPWLSPGVLGADPDSEDPEKWKKNGNEIILNDYIGQKYFSWRKMVKIPRKGRKASRSAECLWSRARRNVSPKFYTRLKRKANRRQEAKLKYEVNFGKSSNSSTFHEEHAWFGGIKTPKSMEVPCKRSGILPK